jgi:hypothetical protein
VASFPAFDHRRQVSRQGGGEPMWRGDGRELFYLSPQGVLMSVAVTPQPSGDLDLGAPVALFQTPLDPPAMRIDQYAVTRDGQRFLVLQPRDPNSTQTLHVIVNWQGALSDAPQAR